LDHTVVIRLITVNITSSEQTSIQAIGEARNWNLKGYN